uniref:Carbohydrate sulfotransferase n=1 Tax=Arion vulgaris TaxID=1028688 RepID=A0A0B6Z580_9EUPU
MSHKDKQIYLIHSENNWSCRRSMSRFIKTMLKSVVTLAKVTLICLNIWVLAVVLVVSLGQWRVFDASDPRPGYDNSHLIVMRELKVETDGRSVIMGGRLQGSLSNVNDTQAQDVNQVGDVASSNTEVLTAAAVKIIPPQNISHNADSLRLLPALSSGAVPSVLDTRIRNLRYWCKQQHPHKTVYDKIPKSKLNSILVDEHHQLLFCQIPGVAINEWRKIMLILSGAVNVSSVDAISGGDVYGKYAKLPKRLDEYGDKERTNMLKKYLKVVFVRDPLERLVIAYRTKLISKGSKYFHKTFGSLIIKKYRKKATAAEIKAGTGVKFSEFVKFIIENEHTGAESLNEHWGQYYKQCHPCLVDYDYVGNFETVENDTKSVIEKLKVSKLIKSPYITDTKLVSQTELMNIYSQVTAHELNNLFKVYAADYTLFGYQCPSFVHQLLQKGNIFHDY